MKVIVIVDIFIYTIIKIKIKIIIIMVFIVAYPQSSLPFRLQSIFQFAESGLSNNNNNEYNINYMKIKL